MGRLELFLSEVSWHAGVLERMAWPCARPDGFSSPSLLSVYSRCTLTFTSLLSPCLHLARSRSPTGFVMKVSERASICASSRPGSHFLSAPRLQWFAEPRALFSTDPVIPLWRHNSSNEPLAPLASRFVAETARFACKFRCCAGLDDYRAGASRSVDDSSAAATS